MFWLVMVNVVCFIRFLSIFLGRLIFLISLILLMVGNFDVGKVVRVKWLWFVLSVMWLLLSFSLICVLLGSVCMMLNNLWVGMVILLFVNLFVVVLVIIFIFRLVLVREMWLLVIWINRLVRIGRVWWCLMMFMICWSGLSRVFCWMLNCMNGCFLYCFFVFKRRLVVVVEVVYKF